VAPAILLFMVFAGGSLAFRQGCVRRKRRAQDKALAVPHWRSRDGRLGRAASHRETVSIEFGTFHLSTAQTEGSAL
jgi:hypothetical protein